MTEKEAAAHRIGEAEKASTSIFRSMGEAIDILNRDIPFNGMGVISDPQAVQQQIMEARAVIESVSRALEAVQWPTEADYDQF